MSYTLGMDIRLKKKKISYFKETIVGTRAMAARAIANNVIII